MYHTRAEIAFFNTDSSPLPSSAQQGSTFRNCKRTACKKAGIVPYVCNKPVVHPGRHKSPHGNLGNKKLRASHAEFDLNERQYADGDSAAAETCDSFCSRCGRCRVHPVDCNGTLCKSTLHDHVRHATDRDHCTRKPMDEMTHEYYWEHVDFEDPVKDHQERLEFGMCGNYCGCDEHLNEDGTFETVHCLLKLWHQPLDQHADPAAHIPEDTEVDHAFIASNGCLFPCRHVTAADVHTMLVIDRSGSMGSTYIFPDNKDIRSHPQFTSELNNVLGVVYEAAYKYLLERSAKAPQDVISFLPFDTSTSVDFLEQPITNVQHLLSRMLNVLPGAGTNFGQALTTMHSTLQQWRASAVRRHKPVVILLTDSEDWYKASSTDVLRRIMQVEQNLPEAERLTVHVIGFGPGVDENFIRDLANIGNGSHLTLQAAKDMDRLCLVKAFARIAAQPALKVSLQD